jgi:hypothetical protein
MVSRTAGVPTRAIVLERRSSIDDRHVTKERIPSASTDMTIVRPTM